MREGIPSVESFSPPAAAGRLSGQIQLLVDHVVGNSWNVRIFGMTVSKQERELLGILNFIDQQGCGFSPESGTADTNPRFWNTGALPAYLGTVKEPCRRLRSRWIRKCCCSELKPACQTGRRGMDTVNADVHQGSVGKCRMESVFDDPLFEMVIAAGIFTERKNLPAGLFQAQAAGNGSLQNQEKRQSAWLQAE